MSGAGPGTALAIHFLAAGAPSSGAGAGFLPGGSSMAVWVATASNRLAPNGAAGPSCSATARVMAGRAAEADAGGNDGCNEGCDHSGNGMAGCIPYSGTRAR
jgi:hypothetical protein